LSFAGLTATLFQHPGDLTEHAMLRARLTHDWRVTRRLMLPRPDAGELELRLSPSLAGAPTWYLLNSAGFLRCGDAKWDMTPWRRRAATGWMACPTIPTRIARMRMTRAETPADAALPLNRSDLTH
jgi:hypothetical protein